MYVMMGNVEMVDICLCEVDLTKRICYREQNLDIMSFHITLDMSSFVLNMSQKARY